MIHNHREFNPPPPPSHVLKSTQRNLSPDSNNSSNDAMTAEDEIKSESNEQKNREYKARRMHSESTRFEIIDALEKYHNILNLFFKDLAKYSNYQGPMLNDILMKTTTKNDERKATPGSKDDNDTNVDDESNNRDTDYKEKEGENAENGADNVDKNLDTTDTSVTTEKKETSVSHDDVSVSSIATKSEISKQSKRKSKRSYESFRSRMNFLDFILKNSHLMLNKFSLIVFLFCFFFSPKV